MALSEKDREKIVEEEKLRFETRRGLQGEYCGRHHRSRWWVWALVILGALWLHRHSCGGYGGRGACMHGMGGWGGGCKHHSQMWQDQDDGEDEDEAKEAKSAPKAAAPAPAPKDAKPKK